MGAAAPFLDLFAAAHPPDLLVFLRALCERHLHARLIQAPTPALPELAGAARPVAVDRLVTAATLKQKALQRLPPEAQE